MAERDHIAEAFARIEPLALYRDDPVLKAYLRPILEDLNRVEEVVGICIMWGSIDEGTGIRLDVLGGILGVPRPTGTDDSTYKRFLRAGILANKSGTTQPDLLGLVQQLQVRAFGDAPSVQGLSPFYVIAVIPGLLPLEISLAVDLLLRAIGQTDKLFLAAPAEGQKFFSYDIAGLGYDEGEWAPIAP